MLQKLGNSLAYKFFLSFFCFFIFSNVLFCFCSDLLYKGPLNEASQNGGGEDNLKVKAQDDEKVAVGKHYVVTLTAANFTDFMSQNKYVLVEFYAPWCQHCKAFESKYKTASVILQDEFRDKNIKLATVDGSKELELSENYEVQGFPTLLFFENGKVTSPYGGPRETTPLVNWLVTLHEDKLKELELSELSNQIKLPRRITQIIVFVVKNSKKYAMIQKLAKEYAGNPLYEFSAIFVQNKGNTKVDIYPASELYTLDSDDTPRTYSGDDKNLWRKNDLKKFVEKSRIRRVHHDIEDAYNAVRQERNLALIFVGDKEEIQKYANMFDSIAKDYPEILFSFVLPNKEEIRKAFRVDSSKYHLYILECTKLGKTYFSLTPITIKNHKYKYDDQLQLESSNIMKFLDDFEAGKLKPEVLSETGESITRPDTLIKRLVASNFENHLMTTDKFSFVMYFSDDCGPCGYIRPVWEKLAKKVASKSYFNRYVDMFDYDGGKNDMFDSRVQHFPQFILYPPKKGVDHGRLYGHKRTVVLFLSFLEDSIESAFGEVNDDDNDAYRDESEEENLFDLNDEL